MSRPSTGIHETWKGVDGQQALFHDTVCDAIGTAVTVLGGPKRAGALLRPADPVSRAEAHVRACLNAERAEKFSPDELVLVAAEAKKLGDHSIINYFAQALGYETPKPITPEDRASELQQQFVDAVQLAAKFANQLTRLGIKAA